MKFFQLINACKTGRSRNYRGILSLTYRWGIEDQQEKKMSKAERLRSKMLALVSMQRKTQIRERIQFLSDNFLSNSNHATSHQTPPAGTDHMPG